MVEGVNFGHALVAKCQLKHLKRNILVLEYNKAKTFLEKDRKLPIVARETWIFIVRDEQKGNSQGFGGSALEQKVKNVINAKANEPPSHTL